MKKVRLLALVLAFAMVLTACGSSSEITTTAAPETTTTAGGTETTTAAPEATTAAPEATTASPETTTAAPETTTAAPDDTTGEKVLKLDFADTPDTLNPHTTEANYELLSDMVGLLYRKIYDEASQTSHYVPELAADVPVCQDDQFKVWTIKMGEGYTFADGTPIDAHTMEYSFKMLNDPLLANRNVNASDYKNGAKYLAGKCSFEEVGFKVLDDYTIELTFEDDFEPENANSVMELWAFIGTGAVHPDTYEASLNADKTQAAYGSSLDTFVASALYYPSSLIQGQYLELTKRTDGAAPLADVYTPDKVEYYAVADANTKVQMFEQGALDAVVADQDAYADIPGARYYYEPSNMGIYLNSETATDTPLVDLNFRYALYWGLDRATIVKAVYPTSQPCAYQYLPGSTMPDPADPTLNIDYRMTPEAQAIRIDGHEVTQEGYDPELAKEYFDKAYEAFGGKQIVLEVTYSDANDTSKNYAEAITNAYMELFGQDRLQLNLKAIPSATRYTEIARDTMDFQMSTSCGWWTNMTAPWNDTNWVYSGPYTYNTQYCTIADDALAAEWDDLFYKCALYDWKRDPQKKLEAAARMEEILLQDASFIPVYARGHRYFFSQKITPLPQVGDPDLTFCLMQAKFN